ncbi:MAG: DinB family protein [Caldilineales bacterium]|nr:DinB family protein [Caldilineales bacterium]
MPTIHQSEWAKALIHLFALASRLEGEGQYNLAKLARAAADSMCRQAAFEIAMPGARDELAADVKLTSQTLAHLHVSDELIAALTQGAEVMAAGQLPLISLLPHPHVCRTCGHVTLGEPAQKCPICAAWPDTFQRFMPNYWFDALEPFAAMQCLRQTPVEAEALLQGLSEAQLNQPPEDGGWAIRNVLIHLRDAQGVFAARLDLFRQEEHPVLAAKAVWTWAAATEERPPTALEIFSAYQTSRAQTLAKLEQLPLAHWWRTGRHEEFGEVTLRQQVSYFAAHELTHLPQIMALRPSNA